MIKKQIKDIQKIIDKFFCIEKIQVTSGYAQEIPVYNISTCDLLKVLAFLKNSKESRFTILTDLFGADFPENENRFEVVYNLLSIEYNVRIIVKVRVPDAVEIPSIASLFSAATWYEREVFDMFGVVFTYSPDQRRILTDYGFVGHPLRKDFPLSGHVQVKYDDKLCQVIYEPVKLDEEFRNFDLSPRWHGNT